jgi:hypothetical protein
MEVVQQYLVKEKAGVTKLALAVEKKEMTVTRWIKSGRIPEAHDRYLIALKCGCSEEEALALAGEGTSQGQRTA